MKLLIILTITIIFLISFFIKKKPLLPIENIFVILIIEFIFNSYIGIITINYGVWVIPEDPASQITFRVWEILFIPLLILWTLNSLSQQKNHKAKILTSLVFLLMIYGSETLLLYWQIIKYTGWQGWQSILVLTIILFITTFLLRVFSVLLKKEGHST